MKNKRYYFFIFCILLGIGLILSISVSVESNTILTNITLENNFTHLNISNTSPYDDLIMYFPFDSNISTSYVYDYSGNYDGTVVNAVYNSSGMYGGAYQFDGSGDYIDMNTRLVINLTKGQNFSMFAWIKLYSYEGAGDFRSIFQQGDTTGGGEGYQSIELNVDENGFLNLKMDDIAGNIAVKSTKVIELNKWYFVGATLTKNSTGARIYINGVLNNTGNASGMDDVGNPNEDFFIGRAEDDLNDWFFHGLIDEAMVFNTSLTDQEVLDIYNNQSSRFLPIGTQVFNNQSELNISSGNDTVQIVSDIQNLKGSSLNLSLGYYNETGWFTTENQVFDGDTTFTINNLSTNLTLNFTFYAGDLTNPFFSPLLLKDIEITLTRSSDDNIYPNVTINSPLNQNYTTDSIIFNVTATDDVLLDSCWYSLNGGITNFTMMNTTSPTIWNATNSSMKQGTNIANFYCNDSSNNINDSSSVNFFIDSNPPPIDITTPKNLTYYYNTISFYSKITESGSCSYSLDGGLTNITMTSINENKENQTEFKAINTSISSGNYSVSFYCNDTLGNENSSSVDFTIMDGNNTEFYFQISTDPTNHTDYGFVYPVTYKFNITGESNLTVLKNSSGVWELMDEKTRDDFFNGIEVVRFNYTSNISYLSLGFNDTSDIVEVRILNQSGNNVGTYLNTSEYYDDRVSVVTTTIDEFNYLSYDSGDHNYGYGAELTADECRKRNLWCNIVIVSNNINGNWSSIQDKIDLGYLEVGSHSYNHSSLPANGQHPLNISKIDILGNLTMNYLDRAGDKEYLYVFVEPGGASVNRTLLGELDYLVDRSIVTPTNGFAGWDSVNNTFNRYGYTVRMGSDGNTNLTQLNNSFMSTYNNGQVYHLMWHSVNTTGSYGVNYTDGSYFHEHLDAISNRKDVWYVGYGHLYMYRYATNIMQINISLVSASEVEEESNETSSNQDSSGSSLSSPPSDIDEIEEYVNKYYNSRYLCERTKLFLETYGDNYTENQYQSLKNEISIHFGFGISDYILEPYLENHIILCNDSEQIEDSLVITESNKVIFLIIGISIILIIILLIIFI